MKVYVLITQDKKKVHKSKPDKHRDKNPQYNEKVTLSFTSLNQTFKIQAKDQDAIKDDEIG